MRICGIHTRLQNVIDRSGGYNVSSASKLLMKEYSIEDSTIAYEMAKNENIRDEIEAVGLEAIIDLTRKSLEISNAEFYGLMSALGNMYSVSKRGGIM